SPTTTPSVRWPYIPTTSAFLTKATWSFCVLASEASIAIENARLFNEERTKARHLSLLNTISRNAIATLNPDEMLAKITEQLEAGLTYDHIGIGVLDYATREVVIQAEAGKRRGTLGQRISLGAGLIGQVARNGHMAAY